MRNPLSAILQSADDVNSSLIELRSLYDDPAAIDSILDSVQVISLCAQHQGRIINDVLTLSKLDSAMTRVTPDICQPVAVVKGNLKMFEGEVVTHRIQLNFLVEDSYEQCKINWVTADPSRLTQIFINIMTNAIKFTKSRTQRTITVTVGASLKKPTTGGIHGVEWFPSRDSALKKDPTSDPEWGEGEPVFLIFSVQDTGRGLSLEEKTRLFNRFSQANIRTHVEYGGSGLGLFISRELTELQGGEIGVVSVAGEGSTFAFYIKGRRANAPKRVPADQKDRSSIKGIVGSIGKDRPALPKRSSAPTPVTVQPKAGTPMFEVLLVEDNLVNQKVLSKQLAKAGCIVSVANHGLEALDFLRKSKLCKANNGSGKNVDIVLMDLEMPVMDGLTCVRHIREMQSQCELVRHVPIIAVTANARKEQVEASIAGGMDDVMPKPFRISELIPKIEKLLAAC